MKDKIVVKNAVKRKPNWLYFIDVHGNLCGYEVTADRRIKTKRKKGLSGKQKFNMLYPGRKLK